jgi:hypothetical protein
VRLLDVILQAEKDKAIARHTRSRQRYADVEKEHQRTAGARRGDVPLDEDRLADSLDEAFVAERASVIMERIAPEDMTLRGGFISEGIYDPQEDIYQIVPAPGLVRRDVDLTDPMVLRLLQDAAELEGGSDPVYLEEIADSLPEREYVEYLHQESVEVVA